MWIDIPSRPRSSAQDIGQDVEEVLLATLHAAPGICTGHLPQSAGFAHAAPGSFAAVIESGALLATRQREGATTMTDGSPLASGNPCERENALDAFYGAHEGEALVIDKWFSLQRRSQWDADR
jgi:hypothetical protein